MPHVRAFIPEQFHKRQHYSVSGPKWLNFSIVGSYKLWVHDIDSGPNPPGYQTFTFVLSPGGAFDCYLFAGHHSYVFKSQ